jgi:hypothetical protein
MSRLQDILRRMALNTLNRMPGNGKRRYSLPKREMRAALDPAYLKLLLSLVLSPCANLRQLPALQGAGRLP